MDRTVQLYGAALCAMEALSAIFFLQQDTIRHVALWIPETNQTPVCWPFLQRCLWYRPMGRRFETFFWCWLYALWACGVIGTVLYLTRKVTLAYRFHWVAFLLKITFVLLDYRLKHIGHLVAFMSTLAYLSLQHNQTRRDISRLLLLLFYLSSGISKCTVEWLSGETLASAKLWQRWEIPAPLVPFLAAYVVLLELVGSWTLIGGDPRWVNMGVIQFVCFHVSSLGSIEYFHPFLSLCLLSALPRMAWEEHSKSGSVTAMKTSSLSSSSSSPLAKRNINRAATSQSSLLRRFWTGNVSMLCYVAVVTFILIQWSSHAYPGDLALTGEGRFFRLHDSMEVATHVDCGQDTDEPILLMRDTVTGIHKPIPLLSFWRLPESYRCDPWVILQSARTYCTFLHERLGQTNRTVDVNLVVRRAMRDNSSKGTSMIWVNEFDVCERFYLIGEPVPKSSQQSYEGQNRVIGPPFAYKWWEHNDWIQLQPPRHVDRIHSSTCSPQEELREIPSNHGNAECIVSGGADPSVVHGSNTKIGTTTDEL